MASSDAGPSGGLLHSAVLAGRADTVKALLDDGADVEATDDNGATPLYTAAVNGHIEVARVLLAAGATASASSPDGHSALAGAARAGHPGTVRVLVEAGADVRGCHNTTLVTPLHWAVVNGDVDSVMVLLLAGADASATDANGSTPLHAAVKGGHVEIARALLQHGANPNPTVCTPAVADCVVDSGTEGVPPLWLALSVGSMDAARVLLAYGADPVQSDAVHRAAVSRKGCALIPYMLAKVPVGADLDLNCDDRWDTYPPPLRSVRNVGECSEGIAAVKALLARGATPGWEDEMTPPMPGERWYYQLLARHRRKPFAQADIPEAFCALLTEQPGWKVDHMVTYWATRKWGCGASARAGAGVDDRAAGDSAGVSGAGGGAASADVGPRATSDGTSVAVAGDAEVLVAQAHNEGLPPKIVCWQSMPRNVVATVLELCVDVDDVCSRPAQPFVEVRDDRTAGPGEA